MTGSEEVKMYRRRALTLDVVCLLVCFVVLYFGTNYALPVWWLATGGVVAGVSLVLAVLNSRMARQADARRFSAEAGKQDGDAVK